MGHTRTLIAAKSLVVRPTVYNAVSLPPIRTPKASAQLILCQYQQESF